MTFILIAKNDDTADLQMQNVLWRPIAGEIKRCDLVEGERHAVAYSRAPRGCDSYSAGFASKFPTVKGCQVRCDARQSIPSSSIESWAGLTVTLPSAAAGQTYLPFSRRLENMQAP